MMSWFTMTKADLKWRLEHMPYDRSINFGQWRITRHEPLRANSGAYYDSTYRCASHTGEEAGGELKDFLDYVYENDVATFE
jgi:hypothetical protein